MDPLVLSGYGDIQRIAVGGSSTVYRGHDVRHGRLVAIKQLTTRNLTDGQRQAFERELHAMGRLGDHPNIVTVYDSGFSEDGHPYLVMPLYTNGTFATLVEREGPVAWPGLAETGVKLACGLETAHRGGLIHRDIKPSNIFVGPFPAHPVLGDFGISSFVDNNETASNRWSMTLAYAAPEVIDGERSSVVSDVYSLGVSIFTMAEGIQPYRGTAASTMAEILGPEPPPRLTADVPTQFVDLVVAMMQKDQFDRPQSALEVAEHLQAIEEQTGGRPTPLVIGQPFGARNPHRAATGVGTHTAETVADADPGLDTGSGSRAKRPTGGRYRALPVALPVAIVVLLIAGGVLLAYLMKADNRSDERTSELAAPEGAEPASSTQPLTTSTQPPAAAAQASAFANGLVDLAASTQSFQVRHDGNVNAVTWSPAGDRFVSSGDDNRARIWSGADGALMAELTFDGQVLYAAWSPDGSKLAVSSVDEVRIYSASDDGSFNPARYVPLDDTYVFTLHWTTDGTQLLSGSFGRIRFWDPVAGTATKDLRHNAEATFSIDISADGLLIGVGADDGDVRIFEIDGSEQPRSLAGHTSTRVDHVAWSPTGELVSGGSDDTLRFWDPGSGENTRTLDDGSHSSRFGWSPSGLHFVSAGGNNEIRVWDLPAGEIVGELSGHENLVTDLAWSPDGTRLASSSWDGSVIVWDLALTDPGAG